MLLTLQKEACGACGILYQETDPKRRPWVRCDICQTWYHHNCEGLSRAEMKKITVDSVYLCINSCKTKLFKR